MLWINGYTSKFLNKLCLTPLPGKDYWQGNVEYAYEVLSDWYSILIDPQSFILSSSKSRFHNGYDYARLYDKLLVKHVLLCGNNLNMVAHSHGVAFAEGMAAYLYEERGIVTENLIAIQGAQLASIPQSKNAVRNRIVIKTELDLVANKRNENLRFCDVIIVEKGLKTGFGKYSFHLPDYHESYFGSPLYLKGEITRRSAHCIHRRRQYQLWTAVEHAKQLLEHFREGELQLSEGLDRISSLISYHKNYN